MNGNFHQQKQYTATVTEECANEQMQWSSKLFLGFPSTGGEHT